MSTRQRIFRAGKAAEHFGSRRFKSVKSSVKMKPPWPLGPGISGEFAQKNPRSRGLAPFPGTVPHLVDDDEVVACALAAQANLIVTGDQDLLVLNAYQGIDIVHAAEALKRIIAV